MTQQQVFSLYLANENQKVKTKDGITGKLREISLSQDGISFVNVDDEGYTHWVNSLISDCKLLLKDIADMGYGDVQDLRRKLCVIEETLEEMLNNRSYPHSNFSHNVKLVTWLITHGYCIDMEWVKAGWVEIVRGE